MHLSDGAWRFFSLAKLPGDTMNATANTATNVLLTVPPFAKAPAVRNNSRRRAVYIVLADASPSGRPHCEITPWHPARRYFTGRLDDVINRVPLSSEVK